MNSRKKYERDSLTAYVLNALDIPLPLYTPVRFWLTLPHLPPSCIPTLWMPLNANSLSLRSTSFNSSSFLLVFQETLSVIQYVLSLTTSSSSTTCSSSNISSERSWNKWEYVLKFSGHIIASFTLLALTAIWLTHGQIQAINENTFFLNFIWGLNS